MTHLIDKDALVAEIKRLLAFYLKEIENNKEDPWAMDIAKRDILQEILSFLDTLEVKEVQEEPVSEDLEEAAVNYAEQFMKEVDNVEIEQAKWRNRHPEEPVVHGGIKACFLFQRDAFKAGAQWQKEHLWKPADGDDLPEIDREVIVLTQHYPLKGSEYAVSFAHRPYKGKYSGKSLTTGNIETFENKTYDKCGWSIPDVKFWLDCSMPKEIEL